MLPETLADARRVFHGTRFDVHAVDVTKPDGSRWRREMVVHPGAVVVLPLLDERPGREKVAMIRNKRFAVDQRLWELPAGTLEVGENPDQCGARELIEETGYKAAKFTKLTDFYTTPGICTERMWAYLAENLTHVGQELDESERITVEVVGLDRTMQMVKSGQIRDGKTIATLLYYQMFLRASD